MPDQQSIALEDAIVSCGRPSDPQLSPDGRWVLWEVNPYGVEGDHPEGEIWIARTDGSTPARQFTYGHGHDGTPRWSPDGRSIAFLSDRAERGTNGLYLIPFSGGEARQLVRRESTIETFAWSPDGRLIAFLSPDEPNEDDQRRKTERDDPRVYGEKWPYSRLHLIDIETGEVRERPSGDRHLYDLAWSPDGSRIAFIASPTPELDSRVSGELFTIGLGDEQPTRVCAVPGLMATRLIWTTDGRHLAFLAGHEKEVSASTVYVVDPSEGEPRVVGPATTGEVCAAGITVVPDQSRLVMSVAEGLSTRLEWLDPDTGERETLYEPDRGDLVGNVSVVVPDGGEPVVGLTWSAGVQPPEIHAGPRNSLTRISDHHAALSGFTFGAQEPFYWTGEDGLELDGLLIRPPEAGDGPYPTVIHVHGGPYGRYSDGWNLGPTHWAQWLAVHGYAVLMPNYRGGSGHGNEFAKWAHGGVGDKEFSDVMSAVDAAVERGIADPDRLGIGGWSQGGFMTAWAVTQTGRFKAAVMGAGVSDWGMMVMTSDIPTVESMLGGGRPWDGPGPHRFARHSPVSYARNVETPLLILHGENDARVPVSQAIGFHRAISETGTPTDLVIYPREPHGIRERNHQRDLLRRVRDWYQQWL